MRSGARRLSTMTAESKFAEVTQTLRHGYAQISKGDGVSVSASPSSSAAANDLSFVMIAAADRQELWVLKCLQQTKQLVNLWL